MPPGQLCDFPLLLESNTPLNGNLANWRNLDGDESICNADELPRETDGPEVVYFLDMPSERQWITVTPTSPNFDPMMGLFSYCPPTTDDYCRWIIDNAGPGEPERWQNLQAGGGLYMTVESYNDNVGSYIVEESTIPCWYMNHDNLNDPIPDQNTEGYFWRFTIGPDFEIEEILVHFKITHPRFSDLVISLISPDEREEIILSHQDTTAEEVELTTILEGFEGHLSAGQWTFKIEDTIPLKVGYLQRIWHVFNPDTCDEFQCNNDNHCPATHFCENSGYCAKTDISNWVALE